MTNNTMQTIQTKNFKTYVNRSGEGNSETVLFLHGSGPGVTAYANWRYQLEECSGQYDCLAPDLYGFGDSGHPDPLPENRQGWMRYWVDQMIELLDELKVERAHVVGNSLGCSVALELLLEHPERFDRVILMGPGGTPNTKLSPELARAKGFYNEPSPQKMRQILSWFVHDYKGMADEIESVTEMRYETAMRPEIKRSNASIFSTAAVPVPITALERIEQEVMLVHGRDDCVCSIDSSYYLLSHLPNVQMHVYSRCGHWTQIEHHESFSNLLKDYFSRSI
ncbi:alpha/beta fold hydrolase [Virgibacillus sediminis]|uniref:Alpha/beta fold hydrolase n=1 Tax=Virgibacillus sediminis TaxID=202260 RepID=A0ABV7A9R0_9BACI